VRAFLPDHFFTRRDAGAAHEPVQAAEVRHRRGNCPARRCIVRHIGMHEACGMAQRLRLPFAGIVVDVGKDRFPAGLHEHFRRCGAEPRGGPRDYEHRIPNLQACSFAFDARSPS
jgi:hypothetical protein